jgi:lipopolysaccharide assembly protein B
VTVPVPESWVAPLLLGLFLLGLLLGSRLPYRTVRKQMARDPRQTPDYTQGMHDMLTGDTDGAIEHLSRVVELSTEPVEVYLALGSLYRQKGQVDRAIRVHQSLLVRAGLSAEERVLALSALGADFMTAGLLDRAVRSFRDAVALHPRDTFSLAQLVKLCEDLGDWAGAFDYAVRLQEVQRHKDPRALSYLLTQKARKMAGDGQYLRAAWAYKRAVRLLPENMLARLFLADMYLSLHKGGRALHTLQAAMRELPFKSYMALDRLKEAHRQAGEMDGYFKTLWTLGREQHQKRALLLYLQELLEVGRTEPVPLVVKDLVHHFGRSRLVQRTLWDLLKRGLLKGDLLSEVSSELSESDPMQDPYTCIYCGYKTLEILHRCPNCKEWNSFADGEA